MSSKIFIFSTLAADQAYRISEFETVTIKGGAGIADRHLWTPKGAVTVVTPEQFAALRQNHVFALHEENGFLKAEEGEHDVDDVAETMNPDDPSKPATADDFKPASEANPANAVASSERSTKTSRARK